MLGISVGASEAETFWSEFLRSLARRSLRGVKLVISDAHEGLKAAIAKVLHATWQRCRVHTICNLLAHAGRQGRGVASAFIATAFAQDTAEAARSPWRKVADQLRHKMPRLAAAMDEAEVDVLAYMDFLPAHRTKLHSTDEIDKPRSAVSLVLLFGQTGPFSGSLIAALLERKKALLVRLEAPLFVPAHARCPRRA